MKRVLLALVLALLPAAAGAAVTTECLPSLEAARAAHPTDHLAWSGGCYFKGHRGDRSAGKLAASTPLPRQRPASAPPAIQPPPAPVQLVNLSPDDPLRQAIKNYVRDQYWVLMWRARN